MKCEEAREKFQQVLGGDLSGSEARAVREHYASCAECCANLASADWVEVMPAMDETLEPSGDFAARFRAKLSARPKPWWKRVWEWGSTRQLVAAGALASVILTGIFVLRQQDAGQDRAPDLNDIQVAQNLPLLQDMAVVNNLDLLEDFDTIENLPQLIHEKGTH